LQGLTGRAAETLTCPSGHGQGNLLPAATLSAQAGYTVLLPKGRETEKYGEGGPRAAGLMQESSPGWV